MMMLKRVDTYFNEVKQIIDQLDYSEIKKMLDELRALKERGGRLFILGVGGSAANASHAVNDFRKIAGIEAYAPTDNVAELTAITNDIGWDATFANWLEVSRGQAGDALLVLSVGGGSPTTSQNIVEALNHAREKGIKILGIVSRSGGETKRLANACILIPIVNERNITPHAESFQAVIWHYLVNNL